MTGGIDVDVLIPGAGGAGLCAALHAADASERLSIGVVVVKGLLGRTGYTRMVQGGDNAVFKRGWDAEGCGRCCWMSGCRCAGTWRWY